MRLGELIEALEAVENKEATVEYGFARPHSSRGDYSELAFDPATGVTLQSMLDHARAALGSTFEGWKGGDFTMHDFTPCYIEAHGNWDENGISAHLFNYWMIETGNAHRVPIRTTYS